MRDPGVPELSDRPDLPGMRVLPTADLGPDGLTALRALLDTAFDVYDDTSFDHALGGVHVLAGPVTAPVGHAAVVLRRVLHRGTALRCGYVESVAVCPSHRGRGLGGALMSVIGRLVRGGYEVGALGADERAASLYRRHGWCPWRGPLRALTPDGVVDTPKESGAVHVLDAGMRLDARHALTCDWRDGELW
ncbi:GNAT family N-acetyltransferase [Pseudonocardia phyllosphaerae]|uniref:GNAT family N-acetyltransferase n=1 Tax=Pseudonocardia phyllosphaerae TaxID=3390502 RepID=UPI00397A46A0